MTKLSVHFKDNLSVLETFSSEQFDLIYIDPPFNTGRKQSRTQTKMFRDENGDRGGFQGKRYRTEKIATRSYSDTFSDYIGYLSPRLKEARRVLKPNGSIFVHIDYREVHYLKVFLDTLFGRDCFQNEIIWAYDYGARTKKRWPAKHDNILWYSKNPAEYQFHLDQCDRIPYMAPGLVGEEKAAKGKTPTDTWWHTIVSPNGKEKTGYPTQKPLGILERLVNVHSSPGDELLDFFAGSGSFGEAAWRLSRNCTLIDSNPEALKVMEQRFANIEVEWCGWETSQKQATGVLFKK